MILARWILALAVSLLTPLDRYVAEAHAAGCPADQVRNLVECGVVLQPRQLLASAAARLCDHADGPTFVAYGGARGGGKSHWAFAQAVCDDMRRYPGLKVLSLRKVGVSGKEQVEDLRREVLHSTPHEWAASKITLPNGSFMVLGHFQHEKDIDKYLGLQYDAAIIEEATQLTERKHKDIRTVVRSSKVGWRPRIYETFNPGGIGHGWAKSLFVTPLRKGTETETRFIQATVYDNAFVNPEYRGSLESLTGWQRRAWLLGDWDIAAGQYFTTWSQSHHVVSRIDIQPDWPVWMGFDYGFTHNTYVCLMTSDGDGNVFVLDEHCRNKQLVESNAAAMHAMIERHRIPRHRVRRVAAGSDVFSRNSRGETIAKDYASHGWMLSQADTDRINGAAAILKLLGDPAEGGPPAKLFVHERCTRLIECIPDMVHDESNPEDVLKVDGDEDGKGGDDPYDGFRYAVMDRKKTPPGPAKVAGKRTTYHPMGRSA